MLRCVLPGIVLGLALLGLTGLCLRAPTAEPVVRVQGEMCTQACRQDYSSCLIAEKGSPNCNVRLQRCLQACLADKRK